MAHSHRHGKLWFAARPFAVRLEPRPRAFGILDFSAVGSYKAGITGWGWFTNRAGAPMNRVRT
jgi:hypothetical protein